MLNPFCVTALVLQWLWVGSQGIRIENSAIPYSYSSLFLILCRCMTGWLMLNADILSKYGKCVFWKWWPSLPRVFKMLQFVLCIWVFLRLAVQKCLGNAFPRQNYVTVCSSVVLGCNQPYSSVSKACFLSDICKDLGLCHPWLVPGCLTF